LNVIASSLTFFKKDQRWIPSIFFGMFGIIFAVNGLMIYIALNSWTGVTEDNYNKGLKYNQVLAADQTQQALGWQNQLELSSSNSVLTASLRVDDRQGQPVAAEIVAVNFVRPTNEGYDFSDELTAQGAGVFTGQWAMPLAGKWEMRVRITRGQDRYVLVRRVFVEPGAAPNS
jgi:nitrogen fixation protein FixH|tara:strand:+ start:3334 stop:3852 length:519 start_codon:yes stop_codon:yes gene_type:complete